MNNVINIEAYRLNKQLEEDLNQSAVEGFDIFRVLRKAQRDYRDEKELPIIGEPE